MINRFAKFVSVSSSISRNLHRIMNDEMEKYGLRGSFAVYLLAIYQNPQGITAARLSEICEKNKAAVSRAVAELEKQHIVRREGASYRAIIRLTEEGVKAAEFVCERARMAVDIAGKDMTDEERMIFYRSLDSIAQNLQIIESEGLPKYEEPNCNIKDTL